MDTLTIALCLSIGCAVAWTIALYTKRGVRLLLWDVSFAIAGAALCALAIAWLAPYLGLVGLVVLGPIWAVAMIMAGDTIRRALFPRIVR
jgi:hypothetical protein